MQGVQHWKAGLSVITQNSVDCVFIFSTLKLRMQEENSQISFVPGASELLSTNHSLQSLSIVPFSVWD